MPDLNMVQLMGNLTATPELRRIPSGTAVTELRLAVNESFKGRDGEKREEVLYIDVTVWDRQAETCCQFLTKGSLVFVLGKLKMEQWDDKTTGEKRSKIKAVAERVQFLSSKPKDGDNGNGGGYQDRGRSEAPAAPRSAPPAGRGGAPPARAANYTQREVDQAAIGDDMSDVPFARPLEFDENEFFGPSVF